jgi:dTDP-4-dehydrorhamnose 3,5-epimerase
MKIVATALSGVCVIEPTLFRDERGFFMESFRADDFARQTRSDPVFVQDNHSCTVRNVLRGLHAQRRRPQGKLIRVVRGEVFDVAVDVDPESGSYGQWFGTILSESNRHQIWIPPGHAHGFVVLSDVADMLYKCTDYYDPGDEIGVAWNDPDIGIEWPASAPLVSAKDARLPTLRDLR